MDFSFVKVKKKNNLKLIKLIVPAGQASVSSAVGPLLGQVGLSALEFCNLFNERSWFVEPGMPLLVDLFFLPGKRDFVFEIKGPLLSCILYDSVNDLNGIDFVSLFKVVLLKTKSQYNRILQVKFLMFLGTLRSYNLVL